MQDGPTSDLARAGLIVGGKFRLDACIGQGGMGSVWSATHLSLGNQIAVKLVSREFVRSPEALRRFDSEAKAAARLQSRHVVQVHDNGTLEDGTPYIAMELLTGESLQQRIDRTGPLPLDETVNILAQCCKALGRAHAVGIVHRDIKPDNIYLSRSPDDDAYVVKVLDFGVAKMTQLGGDQSSTKTGAVLGTPLYMSPEQARGLKNIDHRSDLYSLGIVAYTMVTGRIAFYGESFGDILLKICTEPLPSLRISANIPASLDAWFQRVCARDPAERCASAQEFIEMLRAATGIYPGSSPGISASSNLPGAGVAPTLADSDAPWRLPPAAPAQSIAEANVSVTAGGIPFNQGKKVGAAVAVGLIAGVLLAASATFFALSSRRSPAQPQTAPVSAKPPPPAMSVPPIEAARSAPTSAVLAPAPIDPALRLPSSSSGASGAPVVNHHGAAPPSPERAPETHDSPPSRPAAGAPQGNAPAPPAPGSKPPTSVDLGY